jgi:hypothetical protein
MGLEEIGRHGWTTRRQGECLGLLIDGFGHLGGNHRRCIAFFFLHFIPADPPRILFGWDHGISSIIDGGNFGVDSTQGLNSSIVL